MANSPKTVIIVPNDTSTTPSVKSMLTDQPTDIRLIIGATREITAKPIRTSSRAVITPIEICKPKENDSAVNVVSKT